MNQHWRAWAACLALLSVREGGALQAASAAPPAVRSGVRAASAGRAPASLGAGDLALSERSAVAAGTSARVTFFLRPSLIEQRRATAVTVAGEGVTVTAVRNGPCDAAGDWCRIEGEARAAPEARPGRRDVRFEFDSGPPLVLAQAFTVERKRLLVFALDGLGWEAFESARVRDTAFGRLFGPQAQAAGRALSVVERATFTPITFGRWATMLSGAEAHETLVPSNKFLNRKAYTEVGGESQYGSPDQCLTCGGVRQAIFVTNPWFIGIFAHAGGAYTQHFQVDFIYDRLRARGGRSVVVLQQAGLGKGNAGDARRDSFRRFNSQVLRAGLTKDARRGAELFDSGAMNLALDEMRRNPDFDLLVIYFGGLDHFLHDVLDISPDVAANSDEYLAAVVSPKIDQLVDLADNAWQGTAVYALLADHGQIPMDPRRWMDQTLQGDGVQIRSPSGVLQSWRSILSSRPGYRVGSGLEAGKVASNVIFVPHGGVAHVYVTPEAGTNAVLSRWNAPPPLETLRPLLNAIGSTDVLAAGDLDRPLADILVRQPGPGGSFAGSQYRMLHQPFVPVPDGCDAEHPEQCAAATCGDGGDQPCTLENQLDLLEDLAGRPWNYSDPAQRVRAWTSENTGDLVLLANMAAGYCFESAPKRATHGGLTDGDALVPLAFSYPGLTDPDPARDTTLQGLRALFDEAGGNPVVVPLETRALAEYLGLPWWRAPE